jgi:hypothetical protein
LLLADGDNFKAHFVKTELRKHYRISSAFSGNPINDKESYATAKEAGPEATWIFAFTPKTREQLQKFATKRSEIRPFIKLLPSSKPALVAGMSLDGKRMILLLQASHAEELTALVAKMKQTEVVASKPRLIH